MHKNVTKLECKINEKLFEMYCEMDSSIADVKEALFYFTKYVGQLEDNIKSNQEQVKDAVEERKVEENNI